MSSIQNTPWKDLSKIKNLLKLDFPVATFELFPLPEWKRLKMSGGNIFERTHNNVPNVAVTKKLFQNYAFFFFYNIFGFP